MTTATMTSKGQIVIPVEIRQRLNIHKGMRLSVVERGGQIVLQPLSAVYFERMAGFVGGEGSLVDALLKERAAEKSREDSAR